MKTKIVTVAIYISAGTTILLAATSEVLRNLLWGIVPHKAILLGTLLLIATPLVAQLAYARLLVDPVLGQERRASALVINGWAFGVVGLSLAFAPLLERTLRQERFSALVIVVVTIPSGLISVTAAIFAKREYGGVLGTVAALLAWPYFACITLGSGLVSVYDRPFQPVILFAVLVAPFLFAVGSVVLFRAPRFGHFVGLGAGLAALPYFAWHEWIFHLMGTNSWIPFNLPDSLTSEMGDRLFSLKLDIVAVGLILVAIVCSALRLIPDRWTLRGSPLRNRTWPAFAVSFLVLGTWFVDSVTPYKIPIIADRQWPETAVLHVEKQGMQFHETSITAYRDGRAFILRNNRRLLRYRFENSGSAIEGAAQDEVRSLVSALLQMPQVEDARTPPAEVLRTWNGEGWYVLVGRSRVLAFTTENGIKPPAEVLEFFHRLDAAKPSRQWTEDVKDICLGYCYGPLAGLGVLYTNDPTM